MGTVGWLFGTDASTSKAPVTTSVALVTTSFLLLLVRHLLLLVRQTFNLLHSSVLNVLPVSPAGRR